MHIYKLTNFLYFAVIIFLISSCGGGGGGGGGDEPYTPPPPPNPTASISADPTTVYIGNSITLHGPLQMQPHAQLLEHGRVQITSGSECSN